ncbi:hypothetical protein TRIUR3_12471 [Triticum urartu]|uniref:Uncharacterized protein n=1 Tax=Triticum urartu TaxID=4572 RepID=M7Z8P4_TRIUA|nr:hypothetical protein TRIUR3_12471 [Triticum urartu]
MNMNTHKHKKGSHTLVGIHWDYVLYRTVKNNVCVLHWWHRGSDTDIEWFYHTIWLHALGMDNLSVTKLRMLNYARHEILNKTLEAFGDLKDDEELGPADRVCKPVTGQCLTRDG